MEGRIDVSDAPRVQSEGVRRRGRPRAQPGLREGHARRLEGRPATRSRSSRATGPRRRTREARRTSGHAIGSAAACSGSARKGTLSSAPFRVSTRTRASSFPAARSPARASSWCWRTTKEVVIYTHLRRATSGMLRPAVVDLRAHAGKDIFVRLVDEETGASTATYIKENPWAHINFDHFRFHDSTAVLPERGRARGYQHAAADGSGDRTPGCRAKRRRGR